MKMIRQLLGIGLAAAIFMGCAISPDSEPTDLPESERLELAASVGGTASGADRIYLVAPGEERLLRSVPRNAVSRDNLIEILFRGPNEDEITAQFSSNIPPEVRLLSTRSRGSTLIIDVSAELGELSGIGLTQALAQIVYTASEVDGVQSVQLTVENEAFAWPTVHGTSTDALQTYDYPGLVQSAQPPYPATPPGA
jgi:spore germination protein GerM